MFTKKRIKVILIITILILGYLNYNKFQTVKKYDEFTKNDFSFFGGGEIANLIISQKEIYRTILEEGYIKKGDAETLILFLNNNINFVPQYTRYANILRKHEIIEDDIVSNYNIIMIEDFFISVLDGRWRIPEEERDDILLVLDNDLRKKIEYLNELNDLWMNSLEKNIDWVEDGKFSREKFDKYFERNFKPIALQNYWSDFVIDIEKDTREFLSKYNVDDIKELLQ
ncbi:UNVERIFIED_CONTAM: hypothetical protein Cloal_3206 [Acetivibrio alkalicellulosi]